MELKIIYLDGMPKINVEDLTHNITSLDLKTLNLDDNYIKTKLGIGKELVMNEAKRKSSTYKHILRLENPPEFFSYFNKNSILEGADYSHCELLKYSEGDFFTSHCDTTITDSYARGEHKYTCLIFWNF